MKKIILFLFISSWVYAQSAQEMRNTLQQGKKLYEQADYKSAMKSLESLAQSSQRNDLQLYGQYFYALAAFGYKDFEVAAQHLEKIIQNYPNWQQKSEAYYLLSICQFENQAWEKAYQNLAKVQFAETHLINKVKKHYLLQIPQKDLENLAQKNSADQMLQEIKNVRTVVVQPQSKESQEIIQKMDIRNAKLTTKSSYKAALLFPFALANTSTSTNQRQNQFVLDLYQGMLIAQEEMAALGFRIELLAYDTEQSTAQLRGILQHEKFKNIDFIFGPLNTNSNRLTMDFAEKNQILNIQPLSNNQDLLKNSFTYLLQPSFRTQAQKAAQFALDSFPEKSALIFYGSSFKDSALAWEYKNYYEQNGGKVIAFRRFEGASTAGMHQDIGKANAKSHIFVSTEHEILAVNILNVSRANRKFLPIIATESWLNFPAMNLEQLDSEPIYFLMPDFIEPENPFVKDFQKKYFQKTNIIPSRYAYLGYEALMYFGQKIRAYGKDFTEKIQEASFQKGNLLFGIHYGKHRDNQVVPICRFLGSEFVAVNFLPPPTKDK